MDAVGIEAGVVGGTDTLYVANQGNRTIEAVTLGGVSSVFAADPGNFSLFSNPNGLAFDKSEIFYVGDLIGTITKFTPNGVASVFATSEFIFPK